MSVIQRAVVLAAGLNSDNAVAGSAFEFARTRQIVSIGVNASVTGGFVGITSGSDLILEEAPPFESAAFPIIPDQMFYNDVMEQGDRLVIRLRNPTAGSITFRVVVQVNPVN